ncbi:MAG: arsenate reductase family protein [Alphaproteobacteria bacterium]
MIFTLYHNPKCGTSRKVLAALQASGAAVNIVEYLKIGWTKPQLQDLIHKSGRDGWAFLRKKEKLVAQLGIDQANISEAQLIDYMVLHPILVERPIAVKGDQVLLARPAEKIQEWL